MSVKIRLARFGRIHRPFYRIGAFDSRMRRDGAALEYLGYYDPLQTTDKPLELKKERIEAWLAKGAIPSETVASFLRTQGIVYKNAPRNRARNKSRTEGRQASRKKSKVTR